MGLDMYAYCATKEHDHNSESNSRELAYWRKHPNLHGWTESLWGSKARPGVEKYSTNADVLFNGIELELTWDDLERLEYAIKNKELPATSGFFFGEAADDYYYVKDLEFVKQAKAELFTGLKVFYNSSW